MAWFGRLDASEAGGGICPSQAELDARSALSYYLQMHELSIASSLLAMAGEEMRKHGATKLISVRVRYGALSNIVPDALSFAFESLTLEGEFYGARLEMQEDPLVLLCGGCQKEFSPEDSSVFATCPLCGYEFFHHVASGKEIYLDHLEAE